MTADSARRSACVLTASDRAAQGACADGSGPPAAQALVDLGFEVVETAIVQDGNGVASQLRTWVAGEIPLVITTGGTGLSPRDLTPEQTRLVIDRKIPGIAERVRSFSVEKVPAAVLSRGIAGSAGRTLIVNLPGSVGGARDGVAALAEVLGHAVDQLGDGGHGSH